MKANNSEKIRLYCELLRTIKLNRYILHAGSPFP